MRRAAQLWRQTLGLYWRETEQSGLCIDAAICLYARPRRGSTADLPRYYEDGVAPESPQIRSGTGVPTCPTGSPAMSNIPTPVPHSLRQILSPSRPALPPANATHVTAGRRPFTVIPTVTVRRTGRGRSYAWRAVRLRSRRHPRRPRTIRRYTVKARRRRQPNPAFNRPDLTPLSPSGPAFIEDPVRLRSPP